MFDIFIRERSVWIVKALASFSVGLYLLHLLLAVCVDRSLYADGAFFFVGNITSSGYPLVNDGKHIRLFVDFLSQAPLSLGSLLGVTDLGVLRTLFGLGLFLFPVCLYAWCLALSRRARDYSVFVCSLFSLIVFAMPSEIFVLNQALTTLAVCWVLVHYAILPVRLGRFDVFLVATLGVVVFRSHESMAFFGGALFFAALVGLRRDNKYVLSYCNWHRYYIGAVGLLSAAFVLWWQFSHPVSQQTEAYLNLLALLKPQELWQGNTRISILVATGFLMVLASRCVFFRMAFLGGFLRISAVFITAYGVLFSFMVFRSPELANPFREYEYRFLVTFGGAAALFLASFLKFEGGFEKNKALCSVLFFGLLAATVWQLSNDLKWDAFKRASQRTLAYADSIVVSPERVEEGLASVGQGHIYRYRWSWTWPVLGLSLHESRNVLRIYKPEGYEQYFSLPKVEGDVVFVPFKQLPQKGFFDLSLLAQACIAGHCR